MGERDSYAPGAFCWVDLVTTDAAGATAFYAALLGWEVREVADGYSTITNEGTPNGGIRRETDLPPHWLPYFTTPSVADTAGAARAAGASVLAEGLEVPAGRIALLL